MNLSSDWTGARGPASAGGGSRLANLVGRQDAVAGGVAQAVEEAAAAGGVAPAFGVFALRIGAEIEEIGPFRVARGIGVGALADAPRRRI